RPRFSTAQGSAAPGPGRSGSSTCRRRTCTTAPVAAGAGMAWSSDRQRRGPRAGRGSAGSCTPEGRASAVGACLCRGAHTLHGVEVIEITPELMEAVRRRQRVGMIAQMVLAELASVVAEIAQEPGERGGAGPQVGWATGQLRRDHAGA